MKVKNGRKAKVVQYLKCKNCGICFQENYSNKAAKPETEMLIISISVNVE